MLNRLLRRTKLRGIGMKIPQLLIRKSQSEKSNLALLLKLVYPLAGAGLIQSSAYFSVTLFLAHLGKNALAAGALGSWLFATLTVIGLGTLTAIKILVSHQYGAKNYHGIAESIYSGLWLAVIFSLPLFFLCRNTAPFLLLLGQPFVVVNQAQIYLNALSWGILPSFLMAALLELLVGLGQVHLILFFSLLSVTLTIFFSYILVFGKLGFVAFEIYGAGWGLTLSYITSTVVLVVYLKSQKNFRMYFQSIDQTTIKPVIWELVKLGFPIGLMYFIEIGFFFVLSLLMGRLGSQQLAANQIALQYLGLVMALCFSISQAITVRIGHLLGAEDPARIVRTTYLGVSLVTFFMLAIACVFWFCPDVLISLDINIHDQKNYGLLTDARKILMLCAIFQILESIRISLYGALRALKDTFFALLISIVSFWGIALPCGYIFSKTLSWGAEGVWLGMIIGATSSILPLILRFKARVDTCQISPQLMSKA